MIDRDNSQPVIQVYSTRDAAMEAYGMNFQEWRLVTRDRFDTLFSAEISDNLQKLREHGIDVDRASSLRQPGAEPKSIRMCGIELGKLGQSFP
jgi:hypothetical protein